MILFVLGIFLLTILIHVLLVRVFKLQNQVFYLLGLFLGIPFLIFLIILGLNSHLKIFSLIFLIKAGLLYFALACAYIQTFPAVQTFAPSLKMLYLIGKSLPQGLAKEEIAENFSKETLVTNRLDDLCSEKFVCEKDGNLYLEPKGKFLAGIFLAYRKLYGLEIGEG